MSGHGIRLATKGYQNFKAIPVCNRELKSLSPFHILLIEGCETFSHKYQICAYFWATKANKLHWL